MDFVVTQYRRNVFFLLLCPHSIPTGFNPRWSDQSFQMQVRFPELAVLRVKVMDEDWGPNADDFIGSYTLPLNCLVPGYRHVHLTKSGLKMESGSLFLHIQIQDYVAPHRAFVSACL